MKDLNLPEPVAAYFEADRDGAEAVARCFTCDGWVVDEGRTHVGPGAIEAWKTAASGKVLVHRGAVCACAARIASTS